MRRLQILRGQLQYKPELKDGEFFLDKTNHSLLIGDAAVADGQFELAKQSSIANLQQQVDTKITAEQAPVQSVNTKTGAVVLTAADVGALPDTTSIPTKTSELDNDSGFITAAQAPVQSVDGTTGAVTTNAVKYTEQTLTDDQKTQARTNIGAGTSSFSGSYNDLSNKPTIPSTAADVGAVPTTRTVNGKALSADITLSASDVGALPDTTVIPTVPVYSLTKDATSADYAAVYHLTKDNINVGEPINIPKDLFVESGEIVDNPTGYPEGKYIKLTLQNQTEPIYINVADLVDAYTAGNGITISNTNVVSANVSAGNGLSVDADGIKMGAASGTSAGAMSSDDFTKLSGIETGAQKNTVTSVNGKTGAVTIAVPTKVTDLTDAADYATVTSVNAVADDVEMLNSEVGTLTTDVDALKTNITSKQNTITGGASTITDNNLTANRALVSNGSGKVAVSAVTATELGYLDGVTSNIQTQIDGLDDSVLLKSVAQQVKLPSGAAWTSVTYGNGRYVAIAANTTTAAYSTDGVSWSTTELPTSCYWKKIIYGDKFVAVGASTGFTGGAIYVAYSTDGTTWAMKTPPNSSSLRSPSVAYGKRISDYEYVLTTVTNGTWWTSSDGITWEQAGTNRYSNVINIVCGNNRFIEFQNSNANTGAYYDAGWNVFTLPSSENWNLAVYGSDKFVALPTNSTNQAAYSVDGITWTGTTMPITANWSALGYGSNKFVAFASNKNQMAYSSDGITWSTATLPNSANWSSVTYDGSKFVTIANSSDTVIVSTDGITWTSDGGTVNTLTSTTGTDVTSSVYSALEPYIPTPTVPTKTSELTNDSGYVTQTDGDDRYLKLSGGTVSGQTTFDANVVASKIDFESFYIEKNSGIKNNQDRSLITYDNNSKFIYISNENGDVGVCIFGVQEPILDDMATPKSYVDQYAPHATLVTLTVAGWNSTAKTQTVTVSGILADESKQLIIVMPATASMTAYNDAGIQCTGQAANSLTFTATTVPTAAISVYVTYQTVIS